MDDHSTLLRALQDLIDAAGRQNGVPIINDPNYSCGSEKMSFWLYETAIRSSSTTDFPARTVRAMLNIPDWKKWMSRHEKERFF